MLAGANRLAVHHDNGQWEVIGFCQAELIAPATYRLSQLLRGLDGTDPEGEGAVSTGRSAVLLDGAVASRSIPQQWIGETLPVRAYAGRKDGEGQANSFSVELSPVLPLAPAHLWGKRVGNDVILTWTRRSRADTNGWGIADAPMEHAPERYRVTVFAGAQTKRTVETSAPALTYTAAEQIADFGNLTAGFTFAVVQLSPVFGAGFSSQGAF